MPIVRALFACAALASVCGCASSRFSADAPTGVSLTGTWRLDHAASDDPQKVLAKMREEAMKIITRQQADYSARTGTAPPEPDGAASEGGPPAGAASHAGPHRGDPLRRSPMAGMIHTMLDRGDFLTVRQSASEFVLDYGTSRRSFTPGGHSVVSAEGGVGDQNSGWQGKAYVIRVKPQMGPEETESYSLSPDGAHLLETFSIGSGELPAVTLKRVYNSTSETAPRQLPNSD